MKTSNLLHPRGGALAALVLFLMPSNQASIRVESGWDLLTTDPLLTTFMGAPFEGVPLISYDFAGSIGVRGVGTTDTIVRRHDAAVLPDPPTAGTDTIPIELVALQLRSAAPIDLGLGLDTHFITLQTLRGGPASVGTMTLFSTGSTSDPVGYFDSFFDVFFDVRIGSLTGPIVFSDQLALASSGTPWGRNPAPDALLLTGVNDHLNGRDRGGDFWPLQAVIERHPTGAQHGAIPTTRVPEIGTTGILLGVSLSAFLLAGFARRRS